MKTGEYWMSCNGLFAGLNLPAALKSRGEGASETSHSLPPYNKIGAFLVDKYPACPDNWMRSSGTMSSYFVPVKMGSGMWLDFNRIETPYHLAVVVSVQGVNAITGMPCENACLEQYVDTCPKCKEAFGHDRFCKKCGYKWPKQNYIATTAQPNGEMWIDGFRAADGAVRQYILTEEKARGVAANIIGSKRVYAIGMSFFLSKEQKPAPISPLRSNFDWGTIPMKSWEPELEHWTYGTSDNSGSFKYFPSTTCKGSKEYSASINMCCSPSSLGATKGSVSAHNASRALHKLERNAVTVKTLEVGAGAKIDQRIHDDPYDLSFWQEAPAGIILLNYAPTDDVEKILSAGDVDVDGSKEGFLQTIPTGN